MTKFNHKSLYLLAALLSFSSTSCSDNDEPEPQPKPEPETVYSVQLTISDKGFDLGDGTQFTPGYSSGDKAGLFEGVAELPLKNKSKSLNFPKLRLFYVHKIL